MLNFDDTRTKEFEKLFSQKDIIGLENFIEKNLEYKKIYDLFKGRFYFDTKDIFSFKISPSHKTAALISLLYEKPKSSSFFSTPSPQYNLEILIARYGSDGNFHRAEQIRYDFSDNMNFIDLEDDAVLLSHADNPDKIIRRFLRHAQEMKSIPKMELLDKREIELKKQQLILIRDEYKNRIAGKALEKQPLRPNFMALENQYKRSV